MTPAGSRFTTAHQIDTPEPSQTFGFLRVHLTCPLLMYGYIHLYLRGSYPANGVRSSFEKIRSLSSDASKGIDVSQTHQDLQLDNVRGIGACRFSQKIEGSAMPVGYCVTKCEPVGNSVFPRAQV